MKVLIVEDEAPAARRLQRLVAGQLNLDGSDFRIAESLEQAQLQLRATRFGLLLLDLDLAGQSGFDLLRSGPNQQTPTIVVSANTQQALQAFDLDVIDFVPKPVNEDRLARAILRAKLSHTKEQRITVVSMGQIDLVSVKSIVSISGADDYVEIRTSEGQRLLHHERLSELETSLPDRFIRIHRSHMVNLEFVSRLGATANGGIAIELTNGQSLPVSRRRASAIRAVIAE